MKRILYLGLIICLIGQVHAQIILPQTGHITIAKIAPGGGTTLFHFAGDLGLMALADGYTGTQYNIPAGDYLVNETVPAGWALTDITCVGGDSTPAPNGVIIHLDAGEHINCTFTNTIEDIPVPEYPTAAAPFIVILTVIGIATLIFRRK